MSIPLIEILSLSLSLSLSHIENFFHLFCGRKTWVLDQIYIKKKVILMTQKLKTVSLLGYIVTWEMCFNYDTVAFIFFLE